MAKTSRRSTKRARNAPRPKTSKSTTRIAAETQAMANAESHIDGCDVDFTQGAITEDADLPPAKGGVENVRTPQRRTAKRRQ
jgi:hypothetical protein